ncbi:MAG: type VI secretion system baseplate subunit TssE [Alphaproteobacteria bacterium]|nr:type VI secretion system baseplate subunit TssE [Alphaproteobacteria bacterium]
MKHIGVTPLFDRLIDDDVESMSEKIDKKHVSLEGLKESIREDLTRLLNTKISPFWVEYTKHMAMPFSYGINLTAPSAAETVFEIQNLENLINQVIAKYEPRIQNARAHLIPTESNLSKAYIQIDADLIVGEKRTSLTFPIFVEAS